MSASPTARIAAAAGSMPGPFLSLAGELAQVEQIMAQALGGTEPQVQALIAELGRFHGKMLRPALVLLVARCLGGITTQHHHLGAALELIHTATLIHDDMVDEGVQRRGQPTLHVRYGPGTAVLLGDYFYTRAFHLVASLGDSWLTTRLTSTTNIVCEGELHQMCARRDLGLTRASYDRIIYAKTAALTECACALGALAGNAAQRTAAERYGNAVGMAFQIVDDCLDLNGDPLKVGKTLSTDIERGRLTLPFILMLAASSPAERDTLGQRLLNVKSEADVATVRSLCLERGGVQAAHAEAKRLSGEAISALDGLPAGPHRDALADLARFVVEREF